MKKILILAVALSLIAAGIALATVVSTKHDLRPGSTAAGVKASGAATNQVCVFCHHPHRGSSTVSSVLLWNISGGATNYTTYSSPSMNATVSGDDLELDGQGRYTLLCMSCHDGETGSNSFIKQAADGTLGTFPDIASTVAELGSTLKDDHPVDFTYDTADGDVRKRTSAGVEGPEGSATVTYPLYGTDPDYTMQCGTCHDVHNGQSPIIQFMRGGTKNVITNSKICRDCHMSK